MWLQLGCHSYVGEQNMLFESIHGPLLILNYREQRYRRFVHTSFNSSVVHVVCFIWRNCSARYPSRPGTVDIHLSIFVLVLTNPRVCIRGNLGEDKKLLISE